MVWDGLKARLLKLPVSRCAKRRAPAGPLNALVIGEHMRVTVTLAMCLSIASCDRGTTAGGVLSRPGAYPSPDGRHTLSVTKTGNGIINYTITDAAKGTKVASGGGFSTYHRWFFYWDSQNRLWTYNSDMGPFAVHQEMAPGAWSVTQVDGSSPLVASMPVAVRDHLPSTMKRIRKLNAGNPTSAP